MTRKGQLRRMPAVNVNDGLARVIITLEEDMTKVKSVGRYLIDPTMAMSAVVDAIPVIRSEELKYLDERFGEMLANLTALTPAPNVVPEEGDASKPNPTPDVQS